MEPWKKMNLKLKWIRWNASECLKHERKKIDKINSNRKEEKIRKCEGIDL